MRGPVRRLAGSARVLAERGSTTRIGLLVAVAGSALLTIPNLFVRHQGTPTGDTLIYERIAAHPFGPAHTFPFGFRILTPLIVHVLPLGHAVSFQLLAYLAPGIAAGLLFAMLEALGSSRRVSIPLAVLFAVSPPLYVAALRGGRVPDPLTAVVFCAGGLFIVKRRYLALSVTLLLGALNHESALWLAPWAYAIWARRPLDSDALRRIAAVAAPAVAAWVTVRTTIPTVGRRYVIGYSSVFGGRLEVLRSGFENGGVLLRRVGVAYGPLWLALPFAVRQWSFARRSLVLVPLVLVAMTFGLDWQRFVFFAAPAVFAASAWTLDRRRRWLIPALVAMVAVIVAYAAYMQVGGGIEDLIKANRPRYPVR
jgi:hypothetical protein